MDTLVGTKLLLANAYALSVRARAAVGAYRAGLWAVVALAVAFSIDVFFPLDSAFRCLFVLALVVWCTFALRRSVILTSGRSTDRAGGSVTRRLEQAALLIEARHPELDSALINAVQFGDREETDAAGVSTALMRVEMARAEREAPRLPAEEAADVAAVRASRKRFAIACAAVVVAGLLLPRVVRFEAPRFFAFWADWPPFSLTDFYVTPHGARVKTGGAVSISVRVGGLQPRSLALVMHTGRGAEQALPLLAADEGQYRQTLEGITDDTTYLVRADTGRSAAYNIAVDHAPEVKTIGVTITPPAYTRKPPATLRLGKDGVSGLFGTKVSLDIEATRPLDAGRMVLASKDAPDEIVALRPIPSKPGHVGGEFAVRRDARFTLDLTASDGLSTKNAAGGPVKLLRDEKPLVTIVEPGGNGIVTPSMAARIRVEAEDDVALQRIDIHRIVNNMAESVQSYPIAPGHQKADAALPMDFRDLGVRPGDVIQYYATAYDNDPGKPNLTDTDRNWIWVVSPQDYQRVTRQQRGLPQLVSDYRSLTDALKDLAEKQQALADKAENLRKSAAGNSDRSEVERQLAATKREQAALARQAQALAAEMRAMAAQKPQYDVEKPLKKKLAELASKLGQTAAGPMRSAASASTPQGIASQAAAASRELQSVSGAGRKSIEQALQQLEKLAPLYMDVSRLKQLTQRQAELSMQARQAASQGARTETSRSRQRDLAQQQDETRRELRDVQQALQDDAEQCRSVAPQAAKSADALSGAVDKLGVPERMADATTAFQKPDPPAGADNSEKARRLLESLFKQGGQCQGQAQGSLNQGLGQCLGSGSGDTLNQLASGMGQGSGQGDGSQGSAEGTEPAPSPGSRPGDGNQRGGSSARMAMARPLNSQSNSSKKQNKKHLAAGEAPAILGNQDIERLGEAQRRPTAVKDPTEGRYPAEYRVLVRDYFKSVAGAQ